MEVTQTQTHAQKYLRLRRLHHLPHWCEHALIAVKTISEPGFNYRKLSEHKSYAKKFNSRKFTTQEKMILENTSKFYHGNSLSN